MGRARAKYERKAGLLNDSSSKALLPEKWKPVRGGRLNATAEIGSTKKKVVLKPRPDAGTGHGLSSKLTTQMAIGGMYRDDTMTVAQLKVFNATVAAEKAEVDLLRKRNQGNLKQMMVSNLGFSEKDIAKLNFKDEFQILRKM